MEDEQVSLTSVALLVILGGLLIRYLFFSPSTAESSGANRGRDATSSSRAREIAVERVQQMFPQLDRRTILWELQRNGGNIAPTIERIITGRIETPPVTFQPSPPPASTSSPPIFQPPKPPVRPTEPDLITRYKLQEKLGSNAIDLETEPETTAAPTRTKAWSSNREERQMSFQRRRDDMILAARRKMEAKIAAEKAAGAVTGNNTGST
ncbi:hypothetical protein GGR50DRAFT_253252 [Xylaria sp. CBS 124048]|nr:hypothetical protein GGR50DRAFT_253252 [Xylaria sp. CBS 124048]